jgi:hypothetical protein
MLVHCDSHHYNVLCVNVWNNFFRGVVVTIDHICTGRVHSSAQVCVHGYSAERISAGVTHSVHLLPPLCSELLTCMYASL